MPDTDAVLRQLTGKCFISHSYADSSSVKELCARMPESVVPVIFERVQPDPTNAVSDGIIPTIRNCNALIYLERGQSSHSFWVAFERDYALRSGLDVYSYDQGTGALSKDDDEPLALNVSTFFHQNDQNAVDELFAWMRDNRHFDLTQTVTRLRVGSMSGDTAVTLEEQIIGGGVVLYLSGASSAGTIDQVRDPGFRSYVRDSLDFRDRFRDARMTGYRDRQDPHSPFKFKDQDFYIDADPHDYLFGVHARIDPALDLNWQPAGGNCIDLLGADDSQQFNWNRVDDLIVRLYEALLGYRRVCESGPPATHAILDEDLWMLPTEWMDRRGAQRLRVGERASDQPTWIHSISAGQDLLLRASSALDKAFGGPPSPVDSRLDRDIPFDRNFPAHYAYIWNWYPHFVELSMDIDGRQAAVYVRRVPIPKHLKKAAKKVFDERMADVFPS